MSHQEIFQHFEKNYKVKYLHVFALHSTIISTRVVLNSAQLSVFALKAALWDKVNFFTESVDVNIFSF